MCGSSNITTDEEIERISLSRTKRNIKELALCNNFQYFATITINSRNCDRYSLIETQKILRKYLKKIKRNNNDFKYLFITEKHKDGAFHFHGLVANIPLYINTYGYFSCTILEKELNPILSTYISCESKITLHPNFLEAKYAANKASKSFA